MVASHGKLIALATSLSLHSHALSLHANASSDATFMLVAGATSSEEACLVEKGSGLGLESCSGAVAAADGRELWSFQSGGQLMNAASKKCAVPAAGGKTIGMSGCGDAGAWKMMPNGQVQVGGKCLSQQGAGAGTENVAAHAAVSATSSANSAAHAAAAAVDGDDATFWASQPGEAGPVVLTMALGEVRDLNLMKINWEFPAQSFAIAVSADGQQWTEVFSTTVNMAKTSRIPLNSIAGSSVRIEMKKAHPLDGSVAGKPVFGIKSLAILAPRSSVSLDDCAAASQSVDARDKYFAVSVSRFDAGASAALRAELPALVAAKASLSAALGAVAEAGTQVSSCPGTATLAAGGFAANTASAQGFRGSFGAAGIDALVDSMNGFDEVEVKALLASAKSTIVGVRGALR